MLTEVEEVEFVEKTIDQALREAADKALKQLGWQHVVCTGVVYDNSICRWLLHFEDNNKRKPFTVLLTTEECLRSNYRDTITRKLLEREQEK